MKKTVKSDSGFLAKREKGKTVFLFNKHVYAAETVKKMVSGRKETLNLRYSGDYWKVEVDKRLSRRSLEWFNYLLYLNR